MNSIKMLFTRLLTHATFVFSVYSAFISIHGMRQYMRSFPFILPQDNNVLVNVLATSKPKCASLMNEMNTVEVVRCWWWNSLPFTRDVFYFKRYTHKNEKKAHCFTSVVTMVGWVLLMCGCELKIPCDLYKLFHTFHPNLCSFQSHFDVTISPLLFYSRCAQQNSISNLMFCCKRSFLALFLCGPSLSVHVKRMNKT